MTELLALINTKLYATGKKVLKTKLILITSFQKNT